MEANPSPAQMLREAFEKLTESLYGKDDVESLTFYDKREWAHDGTGDGEGAVLTVIIDDSRWWHAINGYAGAQAEEVAKVALDRLVARLGFEWDLSGDGVEADFVHFWPKRQRG